MYVRWVWMMMMIMLMTALAIVTCYHHHKSPTSLLQSYHPNRPHHHRCCHYRHRLTVILSLSSHCHRHYHHRPTAPPSLLSSLPSSSHCHGHPLTVIVIVNRSRPRYIRLELQSRKGILPDHSLICCRQSFRPGPK